MKSSNSQLLKSETAQSTRTSYKQNPTKNWTRSH